jgi:hypothetical protein
MNQKNPDALAKKMKMNIFSICDEKNPYHSRGQISSVGTKIKDVTISHGVTITIRRYSTMSGSQRYYYNRLK